MVSLFITVKHVCSRVQRQYTCTAARVERQSGSRCLRFFHHSCDSSWLGDSAVRCYCFVTTIDEGRAACCGCAPSGNITMLLTIDH
eukprot:3752162-Pyramimonas_sp.AAC.2